MWRLDPSTYLLQQGELLGHVLRPLLVAAEGESLLTLQEGGGGVVRQGAAARHRQGCGDGEGLVFRQGGGGLHRSGESPLQGRERDLRRQDTPSE